MKKLMEIIARALVDREDEVEVSEVNGSEMVILELKAGKGDVGKLIGKQGKMAHALRTILMAVAAKNRRRVVLEIIEEDERRYHDKRAF